ncbi:MAG: YfbK domain-containing protein [Roseimicrobium sp.]
MNPPSEYDHPDLTAYALGELGPADTARVQRWIMQSPEARAELQRIEQMVHALYQAPALPQRMLHPQQRETVQTLGQSPVAASRKNAPPFLAFRRPAGTQTTRHQPSLAWSIAKLAAAACLTLGAFLLGQHSTNYLAVTNHEGQAPTPEPSPLPTSSATPKQLDLAEAPVRHKPIDQAPPTKPQASPTALATAPEPTAAPTRPATEAAAPPAPAAVAATKPVMPTAPALRGFAATATSPECELTVQPKLVRPLPVPHEFAGVILSSPLPLNAKPEAAQPRKPEAQPPLVIHSWKAEIASCPWDETRRLMRFVAQIPVEQPGIEACDESYKLLAKFDPFQVQGFRLVTEKHMRPSSGGTLATRFAWYEIIPTRNFSATADRPVTIGTLSLEQPRGGATEPLKLIDRGTSWGDAREDFIFETAMIGWSLLLQGTENTSGLNHKIVLDIAEKTKGEDTKGERVKFITTVRQAQRAVGL